MRIGDDRAIAHMRGLGSRRDSGIDNLEQELGERLDIERDEEKSSSLSVICIFVATVSQFRGRFATV